MSITVTGGPMFEPATSKVWQSVHHRNGAHYNIFGVASGEGRAETGMAGLRAMFPDAKANDMNFVLFSTSGVHGSYTTIEDVEESLMKYGEDPDFKDEAPGDYHGDTVTFLIVHPRIVCLRYGNAKVTLVDVPFLKALRASSLEAVSHIGLADEN